MAREWFVYLDLVGWKGGVSGYEDCGGDLLLSWGVLNLKGWVWEGVRREVG